MYNFMCFYIEAGYNRYFLLRSRSLGLISNIFSGLILLHFSRELTVISGGRAWPRDGRQVPLHCTVTLSLAVILLMLWLMISLFAKHFVILTYFIRIFRYIIGMASRGRTLNIPNDPRYTGRRRHL